jgi:hypothetical protein
MDADASPVPVSDEQRWEHIIAAVRGSAMAEVWYEFKFGAQRPRRDAEQKNPVTASDVKPEM